MRIKVCGIRRQEELDCVREAGADLCGFIFYAKSPRYVTPKEAAALKSYDLLRVGVFVEDDCADILRVMEEARLDFVQLHGSQSIETAQKIGANRVIRVLWPERYAHLSLLYQEMLRFADSCVYYLLDGGRVLGGTGRSFEWEEVGALKSPHPWFLAGGINMQNCLTALSICQPFGVDFNSALEREPGRKDPQLIRQTLLKVRTRYPKTW